MPMSSGMSALSKVKAVSVRKDDTKRMEEEARKMEAKLEVLRRTMDAADPVKVQGAEGRWRNGAASKPLTRNYVKTVLETPFKPPQLKAKPTLAPLEESGTKKEAPLQATLGAVTSPTSPVGRAACNLQAALQHQSEEAMEVDSFLSGLKLERYVSLFLEQGFDCMEVVKEMNESHMRDIGMAAGHILKLRKRLAELNPPAAPVSPASHASSRSPSSTPAPLATSQRQVTIGGVEVRQHQSQSRHRDDEFNEEESAASFQEALRAWREGKDAGAKEQAKENKAPNKAPGSFWSSIGDGEVDLVRCSTPSNAMADAKSAAGTDALMDPAPGDDKLCCYQCYKQFYARFAVERISPLPSDAGGLKRLCSEACADRWHSAATTKAEAMQKRQEQLEQLSEFRRHLPEEAAA